MHLVTRAMPIDDINGKGHKTELKSSHNIQPIVQSLNHATSYLWPRGHTHTYIFTDESDYKQAEILLLL